MGICRFESYRSNCLKIVTPRNFAQNTLPLEVRTMSTKTYIKAHSPRAKAPATPKIAKTTPVSTPVAGKKMVKNTDGAGYVFKTSDMNFLDRFLILGTEGGTYYASEQTLTQDAAKNLIKIFGSNKGVSAVKRIVEISESGRAPKNEPALFALALAMTYGTDEAKREAGESIPKVARIGTHILHLAEYVKGMRSFGSLVRRGFASWYNGKTPMKLAEQLVKYANRDGWTHKDVLRMAHVKPATPTHDALFTHTVGKAKHVEIDMEVAEYMSAVEELASTTDVKTAIKLIEKHNFPREIVPTQLLNEKEIWEALLPHMGMTAMVRNIATMTRVGLIGPNSDGTKAVIEKLGNTEVLKKSRIHPIQLLSALNTYSQGHGFRGGNTWTPNQKVQSAVESAFYESFKMIIPTGKKLLLALDISSSMTMGEVAGISGLTPRMAEAVMAMVTVRTESEFEIVGFHNSLIPLKINDKMSINEVIDYINRQGFGSTDCSLPMRHATKNKIPVDGFVVYTDNETNTGSHPFQALKSYRTAMDREDAALVVVAFTGTPFTIADPSDKRMLDVVGFDSAAPSLMADFIRGDL
jgi:60 kDa SS-A/Ro ribonucleoprotein